jgi:hypothetical protein
MPLHKIKDPFHKIKETLSKYLPSSRLKSTPAPMATSSIFGPDSSVYYPAKRPEPATTTSVSLRPQSSTGGPHCDKMFPKELAPDLALFNNIFAQLHMKCRECHTPLALDIDVHLQTWLAGTQIIPPKSQISALQCPKCESFDLCWMWKCSEAQQTPLLHTPWRGTFIFVFRIAILRCSCIIRRNTKNSSR